MSLDIKPKSSSSHLSPYDPSPATNNNPPPPYTETAPSTSLSPSHLSPSPDPDSKSPVPRPLSASSALSTHAATLNPSIPYTTYHIYLCTKRSTHISICNDTTPEHTVVYTARLHSYHHPHVEVTTPDRSLNLKGRPLDAAAPPTPTPLATIDYHALKSSIQLTLPTGVPVTLTSRGWFKAGYYWSSPARDGETLTWRGCTNGILEDSKGRPLARVKRTEWAWEKMGRVEVMPEVAAEVGGELKMEILITALAMIEGRRRRNNESAAAGAGSSGASGAAAAAASC